MINYKALSDIALAGVMNPTEKVFYRRVCRWYSREFATPLRDVETCSPEHVLTHYYEDYYERQASNPEANMDHHVLRAINPEFDHDEDKLLQEFIERENELAKKAKTKAKTKPKGNTRVFDDDVPPEADGDI